MLISLLTLAFIFAVCGATSAATDDKQNTTFKTTSNSVIKNTTVNTQLSSNANSKNNKSDTNTTIGPDPSVIRNGVVVYTSTSIIDAINHAQSGDTIRLENGVTFTESSTITIPRGWTLIFDVWNAAKTGPGGYATISGNGNKRIISIGRGSNVTFNNITFINGYISGGNGAAINNYRSTLTLNNCTFNNNRATSTLSGGYGGAVYSSGSGASLIINNCSFNSNTAGTAGGAVDSTGALNITGSSFTSNTAGNGGAIYSTGGSSTTPATITDTSFTSNTASTNAGALYNTGVLRITRGTFTGNTAVDGGAIWNSNTLSIIDSNFTSNVASDDGGAICNGNDTGTTGGTMTITGTNFINNTGVYGGAFWNNGPSTLTNSTFNGNRATYGGAIRNWNTLIVTSCNLINNSLTTGNNGGALSNYSGTATVSFNRITGNTNYEIYLQGGSVNALNNWWGSNSSPSGKVYGSVTTTTWLVLSNMNATPNSIPTSGTSNVTVDLTHDNTGANHDPASGHVPDGIPVNFTTNLGSIINTTTINGRASTIFTAGKTPGIATVGTVVDNISAGTLTTPIKIMGDVNLSVNTYPWKTSTYTYSYKQQIVMLVQVNNSGNTDATGINVSYVVGNAFKIVGYSTLTPGTLTLNGNTFNWTIDKLTGGSDLYAGSYAGFSVILEPLKTGSTGNDFRLTATINSSDQNNIGTTKTKYRDIIIEQSSDIQVTQTADKYNPNTGEYITITVTTKNNGPNNATGVNINDILPTELYVGQDDPNTYITPSPGTTYDQNTGNWTIGNLGTQETNNSATLTIKAKVTAPTGTTFSNRAYILGAPAQYDWNPTNNSAQQYFTTK